MDLLTSVQVLTRRLMVARGVRSEVVDVAGQAVHHYVLAGHGKGPPVVLVHGLGGSANGFARIFFGLAQRFEQVLAVDLPGHGFSPEYCLGPTCVRGQFDVLVRYCRSVVGKPAFVVGNSLGGAMSVTLAAEAPELVRALALVAPAGADVPGERVREVLEALDIHTPEQARALTRRLFHKPPLLMVLLAHELRRFYGTPTVRALSAEATLSRAALSPQVLGSLTMPTLLIWGESERLLPNESLEYFQAHLPPHAQVRVVKEFGHIPQVERPAELIQELVRFAELAGL